MSCTEKASGRVAAPACSTSSDVSIRGAQHGRRGGARSAACSAVARAHSASDRKASCATIDHTGEVGVIGSDLGS
eukprot:1325759-Prymnesium_polylepis.1